MIRFLSLLVAASAGASAFGQGKVLFANKVGTTVDAPFFYEGSALGSDWSAQLMLQANDGSLAPLVPASTFYAPGAGAGLGYWQSQLVDVPGVAPGDPALFVVRAWQTSQGAYDAATFREQSAPFSVIVGGGNLPPGNLVTLKSVDVHLVGPSSPEPSTWLIGAMGALALIACTRRR